jgi:hypothetical protein
MKEGLRDLYMQKESIPTLDLIREEVLTSILSRSYQQHEVTMIGEIKNNNGKRNT